MLARIRKREIPSTKFCALCDVPRRRDLTTCPDCREPLLPDLPAGIRWCGPVLLGVVAWLAETVLQDMIFSPLGAAPVYEIFVVLPIAAVALVVAYGAYFRRRFFVLFALLFCLGVGVFSALYISTPVVRWGGILLASAAAFYAVWHRHHFAQTDGVRGWPMVSLNLKAPSDDGPNSSN
jgi:hypothetical protein